LLLGQQGYQQEEIGQIIMMYGIGVVLSSTLVSRHVDRTGRTDLILFWGSVLSGCGLIMVGIMGAGALVGGVLGTLLMVAGVIVVGVAHGFINAPVVTHVALSRISGELGANSVTATYRFLERIGHVLGPVLMGQCFIIWGESLQIIAWSGAVAVFLGVLFISGAASPRRQESVGQEITP
jgi:predicted MFS family arabinose efflux permease